MYLSLLVAISENGVIGKEGDLPWHMPADLRFFKEVTMGKPVLMGRRTFESCPGPLPGRHNIVISSQEDYPASGATLVSSFEEALELVKDEDEVIVIGGTRLFEEAFPIARWIYLTEIHAHVEGDTFFPEFDYSGWEEVSRARHEADEENPFPYSFVVLETKAAKT